MIVLAFPTEFEAADALKLIKKREKRTIEGVVFYSGLIENRPVLLSIIGVGPEAASQATQIILQSFEGIKVFILVGFAGAITEELSRGQIFIVRGYSTETVINYLKLLPGFDIGYVHPVTRVIDQAEEKRKLGEETGCQIIDMETAYVSQLVVESGVEFLAIRGVSDLVDEDIPQDVLECGYDQVESRTTPVKLLGFLAMNPKRIKPLKDFLQPLPEVRKKLTEFLETVIDEF